MHVIIFITAKDKAEAQKISTHLVEKRLIACANVIAGIQSLFWWEGKVDRAKEVLLVLKTKRTKFKAIVAAVKKLHSYSVPEVIAFPIVEGNKDYLKWIDESVK